MNYTDTVANLPESVVAKMKTAIELGQWENGEKLTPEQVESAMQAVMLWEAQNIANSEKEPFVVGKDGELYTGKGESHKVSQPDKFSDQPIIIKNKV